jgi:hypothetical protein
MFFCLLLALPAAGNASSRGTVPQKVLDFSRTLPAIFEELENVVAREEMVQQVFQRGRLFDRRTLVSEYQVAHLDSEPSALWEFRFVRTVDGRKVRDFDRRISDFFLLRHTSAREERIRLTRLAFDHSLPRCYWHNLTLTLDAFSEALLSNYEWSETTKGAKFRQVRGPGVPEDFFDSRSPRHYPSGELVLAGDGHALARLTLEFLSRNDLVRASLHFSPSTPTRAAIVPHDFEVVRLRRETGEVLTRTDFQYSDFRRFSVDTHENTEDPAERKRPESR